MEMMRWGCCWEELEINGRNGALLIAGALNGKNGRRPEVQEVLRQQEGMLFPVSYGKTFIFSRVQAVPSIAAAMRVAIINQLNSRPVLSLKFQSPHLSAQLQQKRIPNFPIVFSIPLRLLLSPCQDLLPFFGHRPTFQGRHPRLHLPYP